MITNDLTSILIFLVLGFAICCFLMLRIISYRPAKINTAPKS
jgi:hypothetical protein